MTVVAEIQEKVEQLERAIYGKLAETGHSPDDREKLVQAVQFLTPILNVLAGKSPFPQMPSMGLPPGVPPGQNQPRG